MQIIIITGQSGAGRSTALHVFEDLHMTTADGVPPAILPNVAQSLAGGNDNIQIAIGIAQNRSGFVESLANSLDELKKNGVNSKIIFLKASHEVLLRRYATTRRPHPFEKANLGLEQALSEEADILFPVMKMADIVIDTSSFSIHDLRRDILERFEWHSKGKHMMKIFLISFGFKYGVPAESDMMFDVRCLPNPFFVPELKSLNGTDSEVSRFVFSTKDAIIFKAQLIGFIRASAPLYDNEGRYRLCISIGCTGGRHRSVATVEAVAQALREDHFPVFVEHRHMSLG